MDRITRNYDINLLEKRSEGNELEGLISGKPIVFNRIADLGYIYEMIDPEALSDTDLKDVRLCLNHNTDYVYARSRNNNENSTMHIAVDAEGLKFDAKLDIANSSKSRDLYSAIKRGDIDKMSFMFNILEEDWKDLESEKPTRIIKKIGKVFEISAVTFESYSDTDISCRDAKDALESAKASLESEKIKAREAKVSELKEKLNKVGVSND